MSDAEAYTGEKGWVDRFRPALELVLGEFLHSAQWPEREWLRRRLTQRGLDHLNPDDLLRDMPRSGWERVPLVPDRVVLSLQVLRELPAAAPLLEVCVAMVRRAYELYSTDTADEPQLRSDDPALLSAAAGDPGLVLRAREVLDQNPPDPLGGGGSGTESTDWYRLLNEAAMPAFKDIQTLDDYLAAQAAIIAGDRRRFPRPAAPSLTPPLAGLAPRLGLAVPVRPTATTGIFVIMPFGESWSDGTYAFIRRAAGKLGPSAGEGSLYRADDIADPGQITTQIKQAILAAGVVVADITGVNPNVMWELGYADGLQKPIVILNQNPGRSPFDMVDRRQVAYQIPPTDADEDSLVRHLEAAMRAGSTS
jgi:hypothetical protein